MDQVSKPFFIISLITFHVFILLTNPASAGYLTISPETKSIDVAPSIDLLEDPDKNFSLSDVSSLPFADNFVPSNGKTPNLGFTSSAYWTRFSLTGDMNNETWLLEISYPLLDSITLYLPQKNGTYLKKEAGDNLPFAEREIQNRYFLFALSPDLQDGPPIYIRFETESTMNMPMTVWQMEAFETKNNHAQFGLGMYYGFLIVLAVYSSLLWFVLSDRNYLYYLMFIVSFGLFQVTMNGSAYEYLWPRMVWWNNYSTPIFVALSAVGVGLFTRSFLGTKTSCSHLDKIILALLGVASLTILLALAGIYSLAIRISSLVALLLMLTSVICGIVSVIKGYRPARHFMIAWSLFFLFVIVNALRAFGILPANFLTLNGPQIGASITMIMLALALADRFNLMKEETSRLEAQYRAVFDKASEGIWRTTASGKLLLANQALAKILGYADEDEILAIQPEINQIYVDQKDQEKLSKSLIKNGNISNYETAMYRKDRSVIQVSLNAHIERNEEGQVTYIEGMLTDITEKKRADELQLAKEIAESSSEAKSNFMAAMSHEIRTPMNGVMGLTDILLNMELPDKHRKFLTLIKTSAERLLSIINDILDFSKIEAGKMELETVVFNIRESLEPSLHLFRHKAEEKGLSFNWVIDDHVPQLLIGDPIRITQILINLADNAVKFTKDGSVHIKINHEKTTTEIAVLHFEISDTGIGIPDDCKEEVFNAFSQADSSHSRKFGGTGLGLAIITKLINKMSGRIWVENNSKATSGSIFHFTIQLPFVKKGEIEAASTESTIGPHIPKDLNILLIDDEPINRIMVTEMIREKGWKVTEAESGKEAIDFITENSFDVVLMDVEMPEMDGFEASRIIRSTEKSRHLPIIALTAHAIQGYREKCLAAGMDDYLTKPFEFEQLINVINRNLGTKENN